MVDHDGARPEPYAKNDLVAAMFGGEVVQARNAAVHYQFVKMFEQTTGLLPEQIALLDEDWDVVTANEPWTAAARKHGHTGLEIGGNYRRFCADRAAGGDAHANTVLDGIEKLDSGEQSSFRFVYEGAGLAQGTIFQICLTRSRVNDRTVTVATRTEINELTDLSERLGEMLFESRAAERRRLTRELHDSTMQQLHCLMLGLGQLKRTHPPKEANAIVDEMETILGNAQSELRTMSYLAHPPLLERLGLHGALKSLVDGFTRRSGLDTCLRWNAGASSSDHLADVALYRIVQEALSNISRHAHAGSAVVHISVHDGFIEAKVVDDGVGMPNRPVAGVGLAGMRTRLAELGGSLEIRSDKSGTAIIAAIPRTAKSAGAGLATANLHADFQSTASSHETGQAA